MSHIVIKKRSIKSIVALFVLTSFVGICVAQHNNPDNQYIPTKKSSLYITPDTTFDLPLYKITDKKLQDSIASAISQLEKNWNYNETYGYFFVLNFATFDNPDTLTISINAYSIRNLFPLATFRHLEYMKTIGCIRTNGYFILVDAYTWVSRKEINNYLKRTKDSVIFELNTCGSIEPFTPWPFNQLVFHCPLHEKKRYISPNDWNKYKKVVND